jgi:short-subunit dehydrogenase
MAVDCGIELKKSNVAMLSLYPGAVKTELVTMLSNKRVSEATSSETSAKNMAKVSIHHFLLLFFL